jgi:hypothetical protein
MMSMMKVGTRTDLQALQAIVWISIVNTSFQILSDSEFISRPDI